MARLQEKVYLLTRLLRIDELLMKLQRTEFFNEMTTHRRFLSFAQFNSMHREGAQVCLFQ